MSGTGLGNLQKFSLDEDHSTGKGSLHDFHSSLFRSQNDLGQQCFNCIKCILGAINFCSDFIIFIAEWRFYSLK